MEVLDQEEFWETETKKANKISLGTSLCSEPFHSYQNHDDNNKITWAVWWQTVIRSESWQHKDVKWKSYRKNYTCTWTAHVIQNSYKKEQGDLEEVWNHAVLHSDHCFAIQYLRNLEFT